MEQFLKKEIDWNKFELIIDSKLFTKDIIFKSAFIFLEKWYFFFKLDNDNNILLQFTPKEWVKINSEQIIWDFTDELLNNTLREKVFEENKEIRTEIIKSSLQNSLREAELPNDWKWYEDSSGNYFDNGWSSEQNKNTEIDFDKDIDEILKEIENDPDLKIDEDEINNILKEIEEEESSSETEKISLDIDAVKEAKEKFNK